MDSRTAAGARWPRWARSLRCERVRQGLGVQQQGCQWPVAVSQRGVLRAFGRVLGAWDGRAVAVRRVRCGAERGVTWWRAARLHATVCHMLGAGTDEVAAERLISC